MPQFSPTFVHGSFVSVIAFSTWFAKEWEVGEAELAALIQDTSINQAPHQFVEIKPTGIQSNTIMLTSATALSTKAQTKESCDEAETLQFYSQEVCCTILCPCIIIILVLPSFADKG
jgi:hypothetical protein